MLDARPVEGTFRRLRWGADVALIAILFGVPWLRIGGEPLILLDVPGRKFHVFGLVIFPQELYFLWLILAGLALALFFFTALAGRLWCGWACPQTVFTDVFAGIARRLQGWKRAAPPRRVAAWRKLATHAVWVALCALIAFHLVAYFRRSDELLAAIAGLELGATSLRFWLVVTALAYLDLAIVRQTFCKYLCPYARFQSVLFDRDTLVVAYDAARGEPRGKAGHAEGDCVDCGLCVAVCPTGIDIRQGLQMECVACTQCIDACNGVMTRLERRPNLIGYASWARQHDGPGLRLVRPRTLLYGTLLVAVVIGFGVALGQRQTLALEVEHNRNTLYQRTADGRLGNSYTLRVENRDRSDHVYRILLDPPQPFELVAGINPLSVPATEAVEASVFVVARPDAATRPSEFRFVLEEVGGSGGRVERAARFVSPEAFNRGGVHAR